MTVYRVEVTGPTPSTADELALMLTSDDHYRTSDYLITVEREQTPVPPREHLAWLIWCLTEGYENAEDRAILENWLLEDPATLHPDDAALRPHLLAMADEILSAQDKP